MDRNETLGNSCVLARFHYFFSSETSATKTRPGLVVQIQPGTEMKKRSELASSAPLSLGLVGLRNTQDVKLANAKHCSRKLSFRARKTPACCEQYGMRLDIKKDQRYFHGEHKDTAFPKRLYRERIVEDISCLTVLRSFPCAFEKAVYKQAGNNQKERSRLFAVKNDPSFSRQSTELAAGDSTAPSVYIVRHERQKSVHWVDHWVCSW